MSGTISPIEELETSTFEDHISLNRPTGSELMDKYIEKQYIQYGEGIRNVSTWIGGFLTFGFIVGRKFEDKMDEIVLTIQIGALGFFFLSTVFATWGGWIADNATTDYLMKDKGICARKEMEPSMEKKARSLLILASLLCGSGLLAVMWSLTLFIHLKGSLRGTCVAAYIISSAVSVLLALGYYKMMRTMRNYI